MDVKYMNVSAVLRCTTNVISCKPAHFSHPSLIARREGHLQALPVGAQGEDGPPGALSDGPEEAEEEEPGKALVQVRDPRERGERGSPAIRLEPESRCFDAASRRKRVRRVRRCRVAVLAQEEEGAALCGSEAAAFDSRLYFHFTQ